MNWNSSLHKNILQSGICILLCAAMLLCLGIQGNPFTWTAFLAGAVTNAIPAILLQLVLIPVLVMLWETKFQRWSENA